MKITQSNIRCLMMLLAGCLAVADLARAENAITEFALATEGHRPQAITTGPDGNLWVTEVVKHKILRVTPKGEITEFAIPGQKVGVIQGIAAGADGNIWFTSREENSIRRMSTTGEFNGEFKIPTTSALKDKSIPGCWPREITRGADDNLWFCEMGGNKIGRITTKGELTEFPLPTGESKPYCIVKGADGNMWFTEWGASKIGRITMKGEITEFATPHAGRELTPGADGNFWYTAGSIVGRLTPKGEATEYPIPSGETNAVGITQGPDGNVWFCEFKANKIGRITPDGKMTEFPISTANTQPFCITTGPDHNIWIALQANRIARLSLSGLETASK